MKNGRHWARLVWPVLLATGMPVFAGTGAERVHPNKSTGDVLFRSVARQCGNPPAVYRTFGTTYGVAPKEIKLFRGVAGPDHSLASVFRLMGGDPRCELVSPSFRKALDRRLAAKEPFDEAYAAARLEVADEIRSRISDRGLKAFALAVTGGTSAGLEPHKKKGPIVKFTNTVNDALNYSASAYRRNLEWGNRVNPAVFDATGNGDLVFGDARIPKPHHYEEYDFLSNVGIRHINALYIGLGKGNYATVYEMPWIKVVPRSRKVDGSFSSFAAQFVSVEKKRPTDICARTGTWPEYELTNLVPTKHVGVFRIDGSTHLSPKLSERELEHLEPLLRQLGQWRSPGKTDVSSASAGR
jgi:hypothetical protein